MQTTSLNPSHAHSVRAHVTSRDGTRISFIRLGVGPAVVFVHGSLSKGTDWLGVANRLSSRFTCFLMDRRGHGHSQAGATSFCIDREYDDVVAVLAAAGRDANLVGHSYGAICCLGAATRTSVRRLALYEAPLPIGGPVAGDYLDPYRRAVEEERLDDALEIGLKRFVRVPDAYISAIRSSTAWSRLSSQTPTWLRELEAIDLLESNADAYAGISCPTLLLTGSESPKHPYRDATSALEEKLPDVRVASLPGQRHMAMRGAPDMLAQHISEFLSEPNSSALQ